MILFIDCVSPHHLLLLLDSERKIIARHSCNVALQESTRLIEEIHLFLKSQALDYRDLKHTIIINGPWSFTWIRTAIILVNTINFVIQKTMSQINYFELFDTYPIIKTSSKRDVFIKKSPESPIEIFSNADVEAYMSQHRIESVSWDAYFLNHPNLNDTPDYESILRVLPLQDLKMAQAFYVKKPNIS